MPTSFAGLADGRWLGRLEQHHHSGPTRSSTTLPGACGLCVLGIGAKFELSERRACALVGLGRSTCRYRPRRPDWPALHDRLRTLASERRRFGYRRLHVLLRREGFPVNLKRIYRLYTQEGLTVRRRRRRRRLGKALRGGSVASSSPTPIAIFDW